MSRDDEILKQRYDEIALSLDDTTTACDFHLRDLEIEFAASWMRHGDRVLDVGCGLGVALRHYVSEQGVDGAGIDYSENMILGARRRLEETLPGTAIDFRHASVLELPYDDASFDVVTSHRCLMALLDWEAQQRALLEIHRVLRDSGMLVLMEGTFDGLDRLNFWRRSFGLAEIDPSGRERLLTLKLHEAQLLEFVAPQYDLVRLQRFGMYYFLTRIVQPLLVAPEPPRYDHRLNEVAKTIARRVPDLEQMGQLAAFALRKRA